MRISPGSYFMKNGEQVVLGSPEPEDASRMLNFLRATAVESNFLVRYPEEITMTEADERSFIAGLDSSPNEFMLNARLGDQIIGNAAVNILAERQKLRHRASLGIAVRKDYWNLGLGRELLQRAIIHAGENGFLQIELGVYENNLAARHLYEKEGFTEIGRIPRAFRLKNGTFIDEIQMVRFL